ncbi:MAG: LysM repeat protein [Candidatus Woesearchaeota archaeon]|jgi:LysM repeat protein
MDRRSFLKKTAVSAAGLTGLLAGASNGFAKQSDWPEGRLYAHLELMEETLKDFAVRHQDCPLISSDDPHAGVLNPRLLMAMVRTESWGNETAFRVDPLQTANKERGGAIKTMQDPKASKLEHVEVIGPTDYTRDIKLVPVKDGYPDYAKYGTGNMTAEVSVRAAVHWLLHKAADRHLETRFYDYPAQDFDAMPKSEEITVRSGDYMGKIAKRYSTTVKSLAKSNPHIKDLNKIKPGMKLLYQPKEHKPFEIIPQSVIVKPGDVLGTIAQRVDTTEGVLRDLNKGVNPNKLQPGMQLLYRPAAQHWVIGGWNTNLREILTAYNGVSRQGRAYADKVLGYYGSIRT